MLTKDAVTKKHLTLAFARFLPSSLQPGATHASSALFWMYLLLIYILGDNVN